MSHVITLNASGLASKWGFEDGDILGDFFYDRGISVDRIDDDRHHLSFEHEILARLVERHLLPVVEKKIGLPLPLTRIGTIHNPIRATGANWTSWSDVDWLNEISVDVTSDDILSVMEEVRAERNAGHNAPSGVENDGQQSTIQTGRNKPPSKSLSFK